MINGTDRPIEAVWRIWSENGQTHGDTRKRHAYQLYDEIIQKAQVSQRDSATLRVIEYFAKLLEVISNDCRVGCV